jgi:arsenate reductase
MITLYGITNCDTMKKAFAWLDARQTEYRFHDYRKAGLERERLEHWCREAGWEALVNRRGTTWRRLPEAARAELDLPRALALMLENPSLIRRPVVEHPDGLLIGFDETLWARALTS